MRSINNTWNTTTIQIRLKLFPETKNVIRRYPTSMQRCKCVCSNFYRTDITRLCIIIRNFYTKHCFLNAFAPISSELSHETHHHDCRNHNTTSNNSNSSDLISQGSLGRMVTYHNHILPDSEYNTCEKIHARGLSTHSLPGSLSICSRMKLFQTI